MTDTTSTADDVSSIERSVKPYRGRFPTYDRIPAHGRPRDEVFAELKGTGFDTKAVRTIIRLRKKDQAERQ